MADGNIDAKTFETIEREVKNLADNTKQLTDSTGRELKAMRDLIDSNGKNADAVAQERIDKFAASVETKTNALETGMKDIEANLDKVATALNRTGGGFKGDEGYDEAKAAYDFHKAKMAKAGQLSIGAAIEPDQAAIRTWNEAYGLYMRRDDRGGTQAFQNALQVGSDPDGGYLTPTEVSRRIVEKIYETSPMRQVAAVESISSKELEMPRDTDEMSAGWTGETQTRSETGTPQVGLAKIVAHELYAAPRATQTMLEDAGIDIEGWLARKTGEKFGRVEASAFFTGTGVNQPKGILTYASGSTDGAIEQIASGSATDFTFDGLKDLVFSLKDGYAANASFMLNRLGLRNISKLKDGEGRYLWEMSTQVGQPSSLLGYQVRRAADIPAPGAGTLSAAFGDFRTAYTIVDRLGISTLRDPLTAKPYVIFYTRRRVGGDVVNFEAVKLQVISAS